MLDAIEVCGGEFDGRVLLSAKILESFGNRRINRVGHGLRKKGNGPIAIGQDEWKEAGGKPL